MSTKEYFEDKSRMYYENYLNHKCTPKVRGIIVNEMGQILLLFSKKHNGYSIPGGTIEENETVRDAVVREVYEETGAEIVPIKPVGKYYHTSRNFSYNNIKFDSARVEYFYFCKFKGFKSHNLGLSGEFDYGDVKVVFLDYENAMCARLMKRDKSMIERAINEFLLYHADRFLDDNEGKNADGKGGSVSQGKGENLNAESENETEFDDFEEPALESGKSDEKDFATVNGRGEEIRNIDENEYFKKNKQPRKIFRNKRAVNFQNKQKNSGRGRK